MSWVHLKAGSYWFIRIPTRSSCVGMGRNEQVIPSADARVGGCPSDIAIFNPNDRVAKTPQYGLRANVRIMRRVIHAHYHRGVNRTNPSSNKVGTTHKGRDSRWYR